jgi:hypothetical protein
MPELSVKLTEHMGTPVMMGCLEGTYWAFLWHGGAYIDVCKESTTGTFTVDGKSYFYGEECINVWDYGVDKPHIEFGDVEAFRKEIMDWMSI